MRFGRKVRNLIDTEAFKTVFPSVSLRADSKAAGRWDVSGGGEYFAVGVGGAMTGRGADLLIIDDPHSETAGISPSLDYFDSVYEWYASGPRQRLQPGGAIIIVMTRWHELDLTGQILQSSEERKGSDKWEVIELPALYEDGEPLWPDFWSKEELTALKAELPISKWSAQYQQKPTSEEGALIKREYWREWRKGGPPACEYIIQSIDTAHTKNARSDYSAITTWGVFQHPNEDGKNVPNIILLDSVNEKLEFPELKNVRWSCIMPTNLMDILSKLKQRVSRLYRNCALQVFLSVITLRVAVKTRCHALIQSLTSSRMVLSGIQLLAGLKSWLNNARRSLMERMTTLWTARPWR